MLDPFGFVFSHVHDAALLRRLPPTWRREMRLLLQSAQRATLRRRAAAHRQRLTETTLIGVTGSHGKTTTKDAIAAVLATRYRVVATHSSDNGLIGVPRTLLSVRRHDECAVVELGIEQVGHMSRQVTLVRPTVGVVTAIGKSHMREFGSLENIAHEKSLLISALPPNGLAVLNRDDERARAMAERARCKVVCFGQTPDADVWAEHVRNNWPRGISFVLHTPGAVVDVDYPINGRHSVYSALAAAAVGDAFHVPVSAIREGLSTMKTLWGRMQVMDLPGGVCVIRDDFKNTMEILLPALETFGEIPARRRIAVLGSLAGERRNPTKIYRPIGRKAATVAHEVVAVGDRGSQIARGARAAGMDPDHVFHFYTIKATIDFLRQHVTEGDVLLIKGASNEHLGRIAIGLTREIRCLDFKCLRVEDCATCKLLTR